MTALIPCAELDGQSWLVRVYASRYLRTNVTVISRAGSALVIDAPYFPDELDALPAATAGTVVRLFATHSHFDHLLGRLAFGQATLLVGMGTARALAKAPAQPLVDLAAEDARTYVRRPVPLRFGALQGVPVPGRLELGAEEVELIEAAGHTGDGTALWVEWAGLLCCGDYMSDFEIPLISRAGSLAGYRDTLERLEPIVGQARLVVPGHGTPVPGDQALARLREDLDYLDSLPQADTRSPLPRTRDTPRQREIHRANLKMAR